MTRLEYLRRASGFSQQALGELIHYSGAAICRLERCIVSPVLVNRRLRAVLENYFGEPLERLLSQVEISES